MFLSMLNYFPDGRSLGCTYNSVFHSLKHFGCFLKTTFHTIFVAAAHEAWQLQGNSNSSHEPAFVHPHTPCPPRGIWGASHASVCAHGHAAVQPQALGATGLITAAATTARGSPLPSVRAGSSRPCSPNARHESYMISSLGNRACHRVRAAETGAETAVKWWVQRLCRLFRVHEEEHVHKPQPMHASTGGTRTQHPT